ncbi:hypothetical protein TNCV_1231631 [Trichonephila clavipes]|nr:hypothetical protein TNCV_1231631 [Trichonephila clavipes]
MASVSSLPPRNLGAQERSGNLAQGGQVLLNSTDVFRGVITGGMEMRNKHRTLNRDRKPHSVDENRCSNSLREGNEPNVGSG